MEQSFIIVGSGVAAIHAAKAIRDYDQESKILIFGDEKLLPYNRMKLSKELYSDLYSVKNQIKKEKWYDKNQIKFYKETKITGIDSKNKYVVTSKNDRFYYKKLLLCMGASNRELSIEGIDKEGVFTIRNIVDSDRLKGYIENKKHVVLIGGGVQNLEIAWSLLQAGKKVSIIEATSQLLGKQLDESASTLVKNKLMNKGVTVYTDTEVQAIVGDLSVEGVQINEQCIIYCDAVIFSIGIVPNTQIIEGTPIKVNHGIIINEKMETNIKGIYAAGDVAEFNHKISGLWGSALEQGTVAGTNMAASEMIYKVPQPVTILNAFDLTLYSIGCVDLRFCDESITEESEGEYRRIFIKNSQIVGAIIFEGIASLLSYKSAIESQKVVETRGKTIAVIMEQI